MSAPRGIKDRIFELREQGKSYRQIEKEIGCSRSTISYHLSDVTKDRVNRWKSNNRTKDVISNKIWKFTTRDGDLFDGCNYTTDLSYRINKKTWRFVRTDKKTYGERMFTYKELMAKLGDDPVCYLTGRSIDIDDTRSWHLDHIVPSSKGGDNSLDNCEISTKEANQAKSDLSVDEFLKLCEDVLSHHGYQVTKPV